MKIWENMYGDVFDNEEDLDNYIIEKEIED